MKPFDYLRPTSLDAACAAWAEATGTVRLLSGGTDLTVGLRHGHFEADVVVDLKRIPDLKPRIAIEADMLRIAAGTSMSALSTYLEKEGLFPALRDAANVVGSIQIRNRATLAGNICNASPAADTVPVLAAMGSVVEIAGPQGTRQRLVADFIQGNRQIDLARGEIVTAVLIPMSAAAYGAAFDRITRRRGVDLATANLCCLVGQDEVVFAFGSVSPGPLVVRSDDPVLTDPKAGPEDRADTIRSLCDHASPISDVRASARYRAAMLHVMAERSLAIAKARHAEIAHV
ncbi:MAG: FAD binding domain-containing protein [Pseudomonadota bacterium]